MCSLGPEGLTLDCTTSVDGTATVPLTYTCSYDDGPEEDCELFEAGPGPEIAIAVNRYEVGTEVTLTVRVTTGGGQSDESTSSVIVKSEEDLASVFQVLTSCPFYRTRAEVYFGGDSAQHFPQLSGRSLPCGQRYLLI